MAACGDYKAVGWDGSVEETADPDSECGGTASLTLDTNFTNELNLASDGAGGCNVSGSIHLSQGGDAICGQWAGLWICGNGHVDAMGNIKFDCTCLTTMVGSGVAGTFEGNTYSGGWSFDAGGFDMESNPVEDVGTGTFNLNRVAAGP